MSAIKTVLSGLVLLGPLLSGGCGGGDGGAGGGAVVIPASAAETILGAGNLPPDSEIAAAGALTAEDMPPGDAHALATVGAEDLPPS